MTAISNNRGPIDPADLPGVGRQAIEGNPLSEQDLEMFAMFERENWSHEQRRQHIFGLIEARKQAGR